MAIQRLELLEHGLEGGWRIKLPARDQGVVSRVSAEGLLVQLDDGRFRKVQVAEQCFVMEFSKACANFCRILVYKRTKTHQACVNGVFLFLFPLEEVEVKNNEYLVCIWASVGRKDSVDSECILLETRQEPACDRFRLSLVL